MMENSCRNCRWLKSIVRPEQADHNDADSLIEHTIHACRHPAHRTVLAVDWSNRAPVEDIGICDDHAPQVDCPSSCPS